MSFMKVGGTTCREKEGRKVNDWKRGERTVGWRGVKLRGDFGVLSKQWRLRTKDYEYTTPSIKVLMHW